MKKTVLFGQYLLSWLLSESIVLLAILLVCVFILMMSSVSYVLGPSLGMFLLGSAAIFATTALFLPIFYFMIEVYQRSVRSGSFEKWKFVSMNGAIFAFYALFLTYLYRVVIGASFFQYWPFFIVAFFIVGSLSAHFFLKRASLYSDFKTEKIDVDPLPMPLYRHLKADVLITSLFNAVFVLACLYSVAISFSLVFNEKDVASSLLTAIIFSPVILIAGMFLAVPLAGPCLVIMFFVYRDFLKRENYSPVSWIFSAWLVGVVYLAVISIILSNFVLMPIVLFSGFFVSLLFGFFVWRKMREHWS